MDNVNDSVKLLKEKKIMIIEDDNFLGGILLRRLVEKGIYARLYTTGEGAFEFIKSDIPDILILDILLPGVNGLDILEKMRKDEKTAKVPVLVVSNTDRAPDLERTKRLGATFMLKALATTDNILDQVKKMLY